MDQARFTYVVRWQDLEGGGVLSSHFSGDLTGHTFPEPAPVILIAVSPATLALRRWH